MLRSPLRVIVATAALATLPAASADGAPLWQAVATPTTHTITAIAAGPLDSSQALFATSAGEIFHLVPGTGFVASTVEPSNPQGFSDLALSSDGQDAVAVGRAGAIYHSSDGGVTWAAVSTQEPGGSCPSPGPYVQLTDDLYSVQFADRSTVYATGNNDDVLRSTDAGYSFTEINKSPTGCVVDPGGVDQGFTDSAWTDSNHGFLISSAAGQYFSTGDGLQSAISLGTATDGTGKRAELALDGQDASRAWAVSHGSSDGASFRRSADAGSTWESVSYDGGQSGLRDVSSAGGTSIAVGDGGDIYTSPDGVDFYRQLAPAPNLRTSWRAVAVLDADHAYVGGTGGALVYTSHAGAPPDTVPPTGTIVGPARLAPGQPATYTSRLTDDPEGSGVDPASLLWRVPGQPRQTGAGATLTFPHAGTYLLTLEFSDLAGNYNTAYLRVTVAAGYGHRRPAHARHRRR